MRTDIGHHGFGAGNKRIPQRIGQQLRLGDSGGSRDGDERVISVALEDGAHGAAQHIGLQAGQRHVDGIAVQRRVLARLQRPQGRAGGRVGRGQFEARQPKAVGHQRAGPARRRQDGDTAPRQPAPAHQRRRNIEQIGKRLRADDAGFLEQRVIHGVGPRQRAGVRRRGLRARLGTAYLESHDRLAGPDRLARRGAKRGGVADGLDIERNHPGRRIIGQRADEIRQVQVDFVAGGDQLGKSDAAGGGARQQRAQNPPALRYQPDPAADQLIRRQGAAGRQRDAVGQVDQPDRVRPQDPHRAGGVAQFALPPRALLAGLRIAAGQDDGGARADPGQFTDGLLGALRAEQHDGHVGRFRQRPYIGVAAQALDLGRLRVDGIDAPVKAMLAQIGDRPARRLGRIGRRAHHRHAAGPQQLPYAVHRACSLACAMPARNAATDSRCSVLV
ncbi:Uncharacterised protein [Achromobacter xylosoxidans]|nr:Uncharacterised protein [Achromobacter xylosoxidans]